MLFEDRQRALVKAKKSPVGISPTGLSCVMVRSDQEDHPRPKSSSIGRGDFALTGWR